MIIERFFYPPALRVGVEVGVCVRVGGMVFVGVDVLLGLGVFVEVEVLLGLGVFVVVGVGVAVGAVSSSKRSSARSNQASSTDSSGKPNKAVQSSMAVFLYPNASAAWARAKCTAAQSALLSARPSLKLI